MKYLLIIFLLFCSFGKVFAQIDTSKVIMLVCDTSYKVKVFGKPLVYWQYGYEVLENRPITPDLVLIFYPNAPYHEYLDIDKKPLQKGIVVWQSITTK